MTDKRYRPFSNGSEFMDWYDDKCMRCKKGSDGMCPADQITCKHEYAVAHAAVDDGTVSEETARYIGFIDNKPCEGFEEREKQPCSS